MRILRLTLTYLRIGIANELQYRVNLFIQILQSIIALFIGLIGLWVVFDYTADLNGWSQPELLAVMGVYILMGGVIQALIQPNMQRLMEDIQQGTLDYALTKPADSQVIVSVREIRFWSLVDVLLGFIMLGYALIHIQQDFGIQQAVLFSFVLLLGGIMIYCFWLMLTTIAFWVVRINDMVNLFEGIYAAGRWPVSIYPNWLRFGLTFLVPVAFAVTIPAEALTGRLTLPTVFFATGLTIVFALLTRFIWRLGVRNYSGASA